MSDRVTRWDIVAAYWPGWRKRAQRRLSRALVAAVAVVGWPILLPALGARIAYEAWARALGWRPPGPRHGTFLVRVWWWYGYHGLYQFDWMMKRRALDAAGDFTECAAGGWKHRNDGTMEGWRCSRPRLHGGRHRHVADVRPIP